MMVKKDEMLLTDKNFNIFERILPSYQPPNFLFLKHPSSSFVAAQETINTVQVQYI